MEWMLLPLRRYADFSGRSQRQEYWMFYLFTTLLYVAAFILVGMWGGLPESPGGKPGVDEPPIEFSIGVLLIILLYLALYIPTLAVKVRRFHDQDLGGWFVLLGFIPYLGWLIIFIFMCFDGTAGPNRFGPDPKGRGGSYHSDVFA